MPVMQQKKFIYRICGSNLNLNFESRTQTIGWIRNKDCQSQESVYTEITINSINNFNHKLSNYTLLGKCLKEIVD